MIRGMMQGKVNFISFRTDKTAQEVKDFYSNDRMKAAAWTRNDKGCIGDTEDSKNHGAICLFSRKDGGKEEGSRSVVAQDEKLPETNIFYARVDTQVNPSSICVHPRLSIRVEQIMKRILLSLPLAVFDWSTFEFYVAFICDTDVHNTFDVDRADDTAAATACTVAPNDCSLRGAIIRRKHQHECRRRSLSICQPQLPTISL
jgi:hypothetical protein